MRYLLLLIIPILLAIFYPKIIEIVKEVVQISSVLQQHNSKSTTGEILFTKQDLSKYNGENNDIPIYLSILGSIYDVTKGKKHYGKGCAYNFFAGRDASVAFITGDFETYTDKSDDILQLEPSELLSLYNWKKFYDKEYIYKGKLIGRFYNINGLKTEYFHKAEELIKKAQNKKDEEEKLKLEFPPCNIEWSEEIGTKVWCTTESGGIKREWSGVPRKYFEPGHTSFRCACVNEKDLNSSLLKPYENCDPTSDTCFYRIDD